MRTRARPTPTDTRRATATSVRPTGPASSRSSGVRNPEKQFDRGDFLLDRLFGDTTEPVRAVDGISFDIHEGETPAAAPGQPPTETTVDAGDIDPVE